MTAIVIDPDINAASTELALRRIETQQYRDGLTAKAAQEGVEAAVEADALAWAKTQPALTLREQVCLALAEKFMTKSTSTVVATYTATSVLDGAKLRAAIDEVLKAAA
jgi:hypothetical protein